MLNADEYPLWHFVRKPVPQRQALAISLGPEEYGQNPPFTKTYVLVKSGNRVELYRSTGSLDESQVSDYPIPTNAVRNSYQGRFALAITPTQALVAVQTGNPGGARGEPSTIEVYAGSVQVYATQGYDPQLVYSALLVPPSLLNTYPECVVKLGAVILFYMHPQESKLIAEYLSPPYTAASSRVEFPLSEPLQLVAAVPVEGKAQLWFVNGKGEWVAAQFSAGMLLPRLSGEVPGPEVWNDPQDGSYAKVFGQTWTWRVDKANNRFVFTKSGSQTAYFVPADHSLQDVCFAAAAFDQAGYPAVAYQIGDQTYVKYWNILERRYVNTGPLPLRFPLMLQEATVLGWRFVPEADVVLLGQGSSGNLVSRRQKDAYGVEYVLATESGLIPESVDLSQALRYSVQAVDRGTVYRTSLFPYDSYAYRKFKQATPEYPIEHNLFAWLTKAGISTRELTTQYNPPRIEIVAQLNGSGLSVRDLVTVYTLSFGITAQLITAEVNTRTVTTVYTPPTLNMSANLTSGDVSTKEVVKPYNPPTISFQAVLTNASVSVFPDGPSTDPISPNN
ncbi:WD40-like beta-propeller protein [Thermus phage P74-26]|uniref:WD40-like beta-propeller protein n=1 Tax=Thermus phage P74-26 TaxID=2914007 RepID=A7XXT3_BP742|nr:WD40-like beta-propeller protein [Thermus phage P74-26]ABU97052.1 WD40-like beta-propeller protein [Thermus phage P74-26]